MNTRCRQCIVYQLLYGIKTDEEVHNNSQNVTNQRSKAEYLSLNNKIRGMVRNLDWKFISHEVVINKYGVVPLNTVTTAVF